MADKPNVILISIDTLRSDHLGCYGYDWTENPTSPFIDSLAEKSVLFENHYATDVPTPPSYTSLFYGMRGIKNGIYTFNQHPNTFTCREPSLADYLYREGYRTGMISNLSLIYTHLHRGFQDIYKPGNRFQGGIPEEVNTESLRWLTNFKDDPFFLFVHYWTPHVPYFNRSREDFRKLFRPEEYKDHAPDMSYINNNPELKKGYEDKFPKRNDGATPEENLALYDANIRYADEYIRLLFKEMEDMGINRDNTIFIITSDHGEVFGEYGFWDHFTCHRNISQVPFIILAPGIEPGRVPGYTQHVDVLPTLADLTGFTAGAGLCGTTMSSLLKNKSGSIRDRIYAETGFVSIQRMIIKEQKALVRTLHKAGRDHLEEFELYDLDQDSDSVHNIFNDNRELGLELIFELENWVTEQTGAVDNLKQMAYQRESNQ